MSSVATSQHGRLAPQQQSLRLTRSTDSVMPPSPGLTYASSESSHNGSPRVLHNMHGFSDAWGQHNDTNVPSSFSDSSLERVMAPPSNAAKHNAAQPSVTMIPLAPNKRRRIRVESTPNHTQPGFPYRNSTNLLPRCSQSSRSSGDSSDEVDLDLSYDYEPVVPVIDSRATSAMSRNRSVSRLDPYDEQEDPGTAEDTLVPLDPTAGWSYNSTPALDRSLSPYTDSEFGESLHSKRRGVSPLRILLGSTSSSRASSAASTPTSFNFRRGSKGTELSSPLSDAMRTPRTPTDIPHSSVRIADPDSIGSSRGRSVRSIQQYEIAEYHKAVSPTRAAFPYNLFSSLRSQPGTSQASTPTSSHFPASTTVDMDEAPALPKSLRPADMAGLGFDSSTYPPNNISVPSLTVIQSAEPQQPKSPLSPSSPASPSPGSPLLGAESGPAVHFDADPYQDVLRDPSPAGFKPLWLVNNHQRTASSIGAHRHKRSLSRKLSRRFSVSTLRHHAPSMEILPARSLFLLGFLLGPWCWLIGGFFLRPDGELYGSRKEVCRCGPGSKTCPVEVQREMRLMGVYSSGDGLACDMMQLDPQTRKAMHVQRGTQGHVLANQVAAVLGGLGVSAVSCVAIWMVIIHW